MPNNVISKTIAFQIISSFSILNTQVTDLLFFQYEYPVNHLNIDRAFLCCFACYQKKKNPVFFCIYSFAICEIFFL